MFSAAQDRDEHGAGGGLVGAELVVTGAGHVAVLGHVGDRLVVPGVLGYVREAAGRRKGGHRDNGQDGDDGQQDSHQASGFFHGALPFPFIK